MDDQNWNINIVTKFNDAGAKSASDSMGNVSKHAKVTKDSVSGIGKDLGALGDQAKSANSSFSVITKTLGALAIPAFVIHSVNTYANTVKSATQLGNDWGVAMDDLEQVTYNIGKAFASVVLPGLQEFVKYAKEGSEWLQKGADWWTGAGGEASAKEKADTALKDWMDTKKIKDAQTKDGWEALFSGGTNERVNEQKALQEVMSRRQQEQLSKPAGVDPEEEERQRITRAKTLEYHQIYIQELEQQRAFNRQKFLMNRSYDLQETYAKEDFNKTRIRAERDYQRQLSYTTEDFYKSQTRAVRDFQRQEAITIEQYNRSRMIASRDFQIQQSRAEYDFQKQRARSQYDHNWSIRMAMLEGDAMAIWQSNRQFKIQQEREKEDYELSRSRSKEDFERSQSDAAINFEIERRNSRQQFEIQQQDAWIDFEISRKRTLEQYQIQRKDQEEDFKIQRERTKYQFDLQLSDLQYQYGEEIRQRRLAFVERHLPELMLEADTAAKVLASIPLALIQSYSSLYSQISGGAGSIDYYDEPGWQKAGNWYDDGGRVKRTGPAWLREGEIVLDPSTSKAVE
jgi:hypothetical protein